MKLTIQKSLTVICCLIAINASANTYICTGVDENGGFAELNVTPDPNLPVAAMAHVHGIEMRLIESEEDQSLTLSLLKNKNEVTTVVTNPGKILFSANNISITCIQK